jgi:CRP/FNR family cyclic AMP-dependent transcriptional regulator
MAVLDTLKSNDFFRGLDESRLQKLAQICRSVSFKQGATAFKEGSDATELYFLVEGRVVLELELAIPGQQAIPTGVEIVNPGEVLGWSAVVAPYTYKLTARCMSNSNALTIKGDILRKTMAEDPVLGFHIMTKLAEIIALRLAYTRLRVSSGVGIPLMSRELDKSK